MYVTLIFMCTYTRTPPPQRLKIWSMKGHKRLQEFLADMG